MTPAEAAAQLRFGLLYYEELPDLAASWLVLGLDTPALRELAGESVIDTESIRALWRQACGELGVPVLRDDQATRLVAVRELLLRWQAGQYDRLTVLHRFAGSDVWDVDDVGDVDAAVFTDSDSVFQEAVELYWEVCYAARPLNTSATSATIDDALARLLAHSASAADRRPRSGVVGVERPTVAGIPVRRTR